MTIWTVAVVGGVFLALLSYRWRGASAGKTLLVALLRVLRSRCSSPFSRCRRRAASARGADRSPRCVEELAARRATPPGGTTPVAGRAPPRVTTLFHRRRLRSRRARCPIEPTDDASRLRPLVERALSTGRPLRLFTDGEVDDPDALAAVPRARRSSSINPGASPDAAVSTSRRREPSLATTPPSFASRSRRAERRGEGDTLPRDRRSASCVDAGTGAGTAFGERTVTARAACLTCLAPPSSARSWPPPAIANRATTR
jgi:hypothetical protein